MRKKWLEKSSITKYLGKYGNINLCSPKYKDNVELGYFDYEFFENAMKNLVKCKTCYNNVYLPYFVNVILRNRTRNSQGGLLLRVVLQTVIK